MNIDPILVLQRSDAEHIARHPERYAGSKLLFVDAGILDIGVQQGLQDYELRWVDITPDIVTLTHTESTVTAAAIDLAMTQVRQEMWGPGEFHGWEQNLLYQPLQRAHYARQLGRIIERTWPERRMGLLRPNNPVMSHWDSMIAPEMLLANPERWSIVDTYDRPNLEYTQTLAHCFDFDGIRAEVDAGRAACLTHITTCFYDAAAFEAAVSAKFAHNIDLPGVNWDVPLRRGNTFFLRPLASLPPDLECLAYRERARQVYLEHLGRLIPSRAALHQQADLFARRSHLQAVNFTGLRKALAGSRPHVVLADHDVGNGGVLFSIAAELGSDVTVLPHSSYPTSLMPHRQRVTVIERDGIGVPVKTVLGEDVPTRAVNFRPLPKVPERKVTQRLCLLLNAMTNEGLGYVDFFALLKFHKALVALCSEHGWEFQVRMKPSSCALHVTASVFGTSPAELVQTMNLPIEDVAKDADLCVAYGEPTSAAITFFNAGSLMMHVSDQRWPTDYRVTSPLRALMPTQTGAEALASIEKLIRNPAFFSETRDAQVAQYRQRSATVHNSIF